MKKINKIVLYVIFGILSLFALTSCAIEDLFNEYFPDIDLPFIETKEEPTKDPTLVETPTKEYTPTEPTQGETATPTPFPTDDKCENGNHQYYFEFSDSSGHYLKCEYCIDTKFESHEYGEWVILKEPTEISAGIKIIYCNICNHSLQERIPMLESEEQVVTIDGTYRDNCTSEDGIFTFNYLFNQWDYFVLSYNDLALTTEDINFSGDFLNQSTPPYNNCFYTEDGMKLVYSGYTPAIFEISYIREINVVSITLIEYIDDSKSEPIECTTVEEVLNLPLGTYVSIKGYINLNFIDFEINDCKTGSIRLRDIKGHVHDGLYGKIEGTLYDNNGILELNTCVFTPLDESQLVKIKTGNIIKNTNQLYDGFKFTLGTNNQLISCKYNNYYSSSKFDLLYESHFGCIEVLTLIKDGDYWLIKTSNDKYLAVNYTKNALLSEPDINKYCYWNISIDETGNATIQSIFNPDLCIRFSSDITPNGVLGSDDETLSLPCIYEVVEVNNIPATYIELYVRGSFNDWNVDDDHELLYNIITKTYFYSFYVEKGSEFKIADNEWNFIFADYNIQANFDLNLTDSNDNIVIPYTGVYNIIFSLDENYFFVEFMPNPEDVYLTCSLNDYEVLEQNKFYTPYNINNLVFDLNIEEGSQYLYSIKSFIGYYFFDLGMISDYVTIDILSETIDFKEPGTYRIIIENYNDVDKQLLHIIYSNDLNQTIQESLNLPDSTIVKLEGEFILENKKMYLSDGINCILVYNYTHVHNGDYGIIEGEINTYNDTKQITNGIVNILETTYNNEVLLDYQIINEDQLYDGLQIVISSGNYIMTCQNTKYRNVGYFENLNDVLNSCIEVFTLVKKDDYWQLKSANGEYLYLKDGLNNELYSGNINDESSLWIISFVDGYCQINNVLYNTRYIQFNYYEGSERFSSYRNTLINPIIYAVKNDD